MSRHLNRPRIRCAAESLERRWLLSATDLDTSFSIDGVVTDSLNGGANNLHAIAVQSDGKVIVAGEAHLSETSHAYGFAAIRYNADGTLDDGGDNDSTPGDSFGPDGKFFYLQGTFSTVTSIAIQKDGKIILAGWADSSGASPQQYWLMVRLNTNGSFDKTFNHNGVVAYPFGQFNTPLTAIALQSDGKIVAVGSVDGDFMVGRFNADGSQDGEFGSAGVVTADFGGTDAATGVAIDNIGRIDVVGGTGGNGVKQNIGVARFLTDGTLDTGFGTGGQAQSSDKLLDQSIEIHNAALTDAGDIDIAFSKFEIADNEWISGLMTFPSDGSGDGSSGSEKVKINALTETPDGKVVTAGTNLGAQENRSDFYVQIGNSSGTPAVGFSNASGATAMAAAPDGSVYVGGFADHGGARDFLLAKFVGVDTTTFGTISGNVYRDTDGDGVRDPNETGLANVRVYLDTNNDGTFDANQFDDEPYTFTDASGNYRFRGLSPGNAIVRQVLPSKLTQEVPASSYTVAVTGGKTFSGRIFADKPFALASSITAITGSVFNDYNNDARRETTGTIEPDMTNVVVYIDGNRNGKLDSNETYAKTDVSGNYTLALPKAGNFRVVVAPPRGYTSTTAGFFDIVVHTHAQGIAHFGLTPIDANDSLTEAHALTLGRTIVDTIANSTDVNTYSFTVKAGQTILFDLDLAKGSALNSYLRLFDSHGNQLVANDNAAAPGETISNDSYIRHFFDKKGTYYISVSSNLNTKYNPLTGKDDLGGGTLGAYDLLVKAV